MKFEKLTTFVILVLFTLISSCNTIKLENVTSNQDLNRNIEFVTILSEKDKLVNGKKKIGDLIFKENKNSDWNYLKNKMTDFAKLNGANTIEVKTFGWGKKGNVFYLEANLYYIDNETILSNFEKNQNCSIVVFRDGLESPLGSNFTINATIDNTKFENLKKSIYFKKDIEDCNTEYDVLINKDQYKVKLNGKSKYYKVAKQTSGGYVGSGVQIGIGGVSFVEIEDEILGRLLMREAD